MSAIRSEDQRPESHDHVGGDREDPVAAARSIGFLGRLSPELAAHLIRFAPLVHYPAGSVTDPHSDAAWAAVVVSGVFRKYLPMPDGRQITLRYARVGALVGWLTADSHWFRPEIQAIEPSGLLHLDMARLERARRHEPELSMALADELSNRLVQAYAILANTAFATVRSRVARDLLERMGRPEVRRPGAHVRVTQQGLADATGSVREVVGRALRELRLLGVIETDPSGVTILKVDALIAEAGP